MKTIAVIDVAWCRDHGVQLKVLCEICRRDWRELHAHDLIDTSKPRDVNRDHEGAEADVDNGKSYASLTSWIAGPGLSAYLFEYQCALRHRTYAAMKTKNTGTHFHYAAEKEKVRV